MKKSFFIILFSASSLIVGTNCFAQIQFQRAIGEGSNGFHAYSIVQTTDRGYAAAGSMGSNMYIVKLDSIGTLQWNKKISVNIVFNDIAYSIIQSSDGGYAVTGHTGGNIHNVYVVKLDSIGTLQWSRTVGIVSNGHRAYSIIQTTDGGYAVAGATGPLGSGNVDMYVVKLNPSGSLQWSRTIGGPFEDIAYSIIQTTDGGYAVAGEIQGSGYRNMFIVKLDGDGMLQWSRAIGGMYEIARSIIQTTDGSYVITGYTLSLGAGLFDVYVVKIDSSGSLQWTRTVGGEDNDNAYSLIQTTDGGYIVAGSTQSFGAGGYDMYIVKLDVGGALQWTKTVGGAGLDIAYSIVRTNDRGYAVAGTTYSFGTGWGDMYIVKFDSNGNTCGNTSSPTSTQGTGGITGTGGYVNSPTSIVNSLTSTAETRGTIINICTTIGIIKQQGEIPKTFKLYQNYPNPFNPSTKIKFDIPPSPLNERGDKGGFITLKVYDILGREVATLVNEPLKPGSYEVGWDASNYPSGVYFYKISAGKYAETKKMILLK